MNEVEELYCPRCNNNSMIKDGKIRNKQSYQCKNCKYKTISPLNLLNETNTCKKIKITSPINNPTNIKFQEEKNRSIVEFTTEKNKTIEQLVKECGINLNIWKIEKYSINKTDNIKKNGPKLVTIPTYNIKASLSKIIPDVQQFPNIQPIKINSVKIVNSNKKNNKKFKKALIIPDAQIGFRRNLTNNNLDPFHDRKCLDVILKISEQMKPDVIVLLGDMIDFPEQSDKFLKSPEFYFTTQPSTIELGWFISQLRNLNPSSKIVYLEGNHEKRLHKSIVCNLLHSYNLKPFNDLNSPGVLTVENLLDLKSLNVEYMGNYPHDEFWLNDNLKIIHGNIAKAGSGDTVKEVLRNSRSSVIQGHIHRIESASKTVHTKDKIISYTVASFGCICKTDGSVPSNNPNENWQNGFGVIEYEDGNGAFQMHPYSINNGEVLLDGKIIMGNEVEYLKHLKKDTKWGF